MSETREQAQARILAMSWEEREARIRAEDSSWRVPARKRGEKRTNPPWAVPLVLGSTHWNFKEEGRT